MRELNELELELVAGGAYAADSSYADAYAVFGVTYTKSTDKTNYYSNGSFTLKTSSQAFAAGILPSAHSGANSEIYS